MDFVIFFRRFVKVEIYGSGLMDMGVGVFIIFNVIVFLEVRGIYLSDIGYIVVVFRFLKLFLSFLVFGVMRFLFVKSIDY